MRHVRQCALQFHLGGGKRHFRLLAFGDVLIDAIGLYGPCCPVFDDDEAHRGVARCSVTIEYAMFERTGEVGVICLDCRLYLAPHNLSVIRMHEPAGIVSGTHGVATDRLGGGAVDAIEVVVEGETIRLDVVFPVACAQNLERVRVFGLAGAEGDFRLLSGADVDHHADRGGFSLEDGCRRVDENVDSVSALVGYRRLELDETALAGNAVFHDFGDPRLVLLRSEIENRLADQIRRQNTNQSSEIWVDVSNGTVGPDNDDADRYLFERGSGLIHLPEQIARGVG